MHWKIILFSILNIGLAGLVYANTPSSFTLTSTAALDQGALPALYTCDGNDKSPQLAWSGSSEKTRSFALIMADPDAPNGTWYHWVLYNIPKETKELAEDIKTLPLGTVTGSNSWGKTEYNGPCPPNGSSHHYIFTLYALDASLNLSTLQDGETLLKTIKPHTLQQTQFEVIYRR